MGWGGRGGGEERWSFERGPGRLCGAAGMQSPEDFGGGILVQLGM